MKQPPDTARDVLEWIDNTNGLGHLFDIIRAATERAYYLGHNDGQQNRSLCSKKDLPQK
jgi:hypothetical protein